MGKPYCFVKVVEGGYIIEWHDSPFDDKTIVCPTVEAMTMRLKRLFEETESRLTEDCEYCGGSGLVPGNNDFTSSLFGSMNSGEVSCSRCYRTGVQKKKRNDPPGKN